MSSTYHYHLNNAITRKTYNLRNGLDDEHLPNPWGTALILPRTIGTQKVTIFGPFKQIKHNRTIDYCARTISDKLQYKYPLIPRLESEYIVQTFQSTIHSNSECATNGGKICMCIYKTYTNELNLEWPIFPTTLLPFYHFLTCIKMLGSRDDVFLLTNLIKHGNDHNGF